MESGGACGLSEAATKIGLRAMLSSRDKVTDAFLCCFVWSVRSMTFA